MKVISVLESLPGLGKVKARRLMETVGISDSRRLQGLGAKQREALLKETRAEPLIFVLIGPGGAGKGTVAPSWWPTTRRLWLRSWTNASPRPVSATRRLRLRRSRDVRDRVARVDSSSGPSSSATSTARRCPTRPRAPTSCSRSTSKAPAGPGPASRRHGDLAASSLPRGPGGAAGGPWRRRATTSAAGSSSAEPKSSAGREMADSRGGQRRPRSGGGRGAGYS